MKMNKKGFTLIEMLVVIAIIAVLVSIVIPVVGNSTEKAELAADAANIRAAVAEVTTRQLGDGDATYKKVVMESEGDFSLIDVDEIGGIAVANITPDNDGNVYIYWNGTKVAAASAAPEGCTDIDAPVTDTP